MRLRHLIIFLAFSTLLLQSVYQSYKISSERNEIDHLETLVNEIKNHTGSPPKVYFVSIKENYRLYFQLQFVFVPQLVVFINPSKVTAGSTCLIVEDRNDPESSGSYNGLIEKSDLLYSTSNEYFVMNLIKTK